MVGLVWKQEGKENQPLAPRQRILKVAKNKTKQDNMNNKEIELLNEKKFEKNCRQCHYDISENGKEINEEREGLCFQCWVDRDGAMGEEFESRF